MAIDNSKKKISIIAVCAVAIAAVSIGSTMAYFSDRDNQENLLQIEKNVIEIEEDYSKPDSVPDPGETITKNPSVKNTEGVDCYVRMYCEFSDTLSEEYFDLDFDTINWVKESDGYWYYTSIIAEGESTTPLFTEMTVTSDASNLEDVDLICYAESVQATDASTGESFSDYTSAWEYWNSEKEGID